MGRPCWMTCQVIQHGRLIQNGNIEIFELQLLRQNYDKNETKFAT